MKTTDAYLTSHGRTELVENWKRREGQKTEREEQKTDINIYGQPDIGFTP